MYDLSQLPDQRAAGYRLLSHQGSMARLPSVPPEVNGKAAICLTRGQW